jgi:uncharacterized membrane protein YqjE
MTTMARDEFEIRIPPGADSAGTHVPAGAEPPLAELLRRLTTDASDLVRAEMALAKAELRETGTALARDAAKLAVAGGLALAGALAITAFLVIALGALFNNYWLSALVVGVALLAIGGLLVRSAVADVKRRGVMPAQTMESLREDAQWAKDEARQVKRELTE